MSANRIFIFVVGKNILSHFDFLFAIELKAILYFVHILTKAQPLFEWIKYSNLFIAWNVMTSEPYNFMEIVFKYVCFSTIFLKMQLLFLHFFFVWIKDEKKTKFSCIFSILNVIKHWITVHISKFIWIPLSMLNVVMFCMAKIHKTQKNS